VEKEEEEGEEYYHNRWLRWDAISGSSSSSSRCLLSLNAVDDSAIIMP